MTKLSKSSRKIKTNNTKNTKATKTIQQKFWFAARRGISYGWYPVSWQGWVCLFLTVCSVIFSGITIALNKIPRTVVFCLIQVAITGVLFFAISFATCEKPVLKWNMD